MKSQTIKKLKPMKSPRTPPQSATRSSNVNSISSFSTQTLELANTTESTVAFSFSETMAETGSSAI